MVEQYNLQRQLEAVQSQQKQLLQQGIPPGNLQPNFQQNLQSDFGLPHLRSPSFNASLNHRRTGSTLSQQGHSRRHSLGVNEAIKAAASQRQLNYQNTQGAPAAGAPQINVSIGAGGGGDLPYHLLPPLGPDPISQFRFPSTTCPNYAAAAAAGPISSNHESPVNRGHARSRSAAYGQPPLLLLLPLFKFPADNNPLLPPAPGYSNLSPERGGSGGGHLRRSSHFRLNSKNFDTNSSINSNWRSQQQPAASNPSASFTHQRNASSTLEPPSLFVPGHKGRGGSYGGGSVSSLSLFMPGNSGSNSGGNSGGRKSLFAPYLPQLSLPELINEGRLVTGILRVNKKNRSDAYVSTDGLLDADIFICGSKDRNRALEGDLVAVELLVVDEVWESKKEKEEKKRRKDNTLTKNNATSVLSDDIHNDATSTLPGNDESKTDKDGEGLGRRGSLKQRPTMKKNDDVEVEGQALLLVEEEEINDEVKPLYAGHVVAVVDRIPGQIFAGTLGLLRPAQAAQAAIDKKTGKEPSVQTPKAPKIVWFKPTDKRVPLIAIPTEQAPKDFVENHEKYADQVFIALIKRWPITSLHPFGTLVSKLGKYDDPQVEIDSILRDNNFTDEYYSGLDGDDGLVKSLIASLPSVESEMSNPDRAGFFNDYIIAFTENKLFVDNAMHVKRLSDTIIELGFHAVDISHFVQPGSPLERKAKKISSSVFLPQKALHLYPNEFNDLISFKDNEKSLAISVTFEIDTTSFEVEKVHIRESVVVPKLTVSFDDVDAILSNKKPNDEITSATCDYIKTFALIAKEFRRQRLNDRNLGISPSLTLLDQLDDEKVRLHLNIFEYSSALRIVSEIGHKVNATVAAKVHATLGDEAFLRRQALPTLQKIENFSRKAYNLGFKIDTSTSSSLQQSILKINDPLKRQCIETLLYKCMPRAKYYIAGKQDPENYSHYYLNLPLYTHFTSPLRRFADLIVHRQVKQAISASAERDKIPDLDALKGISDYCNFKKDCAANAQEQAIHLLLSQTINEMSEHAGQLLVMGTVLQVYESSFDVFIPEFGIEKRVHGDQLPLVKAEFDKANRILELFWEKGVDAATYVPPDEKSSLSYRNSIKNKYRTSALEAAKIQRKNALERDNNIVPDSIVEKLKALSIDMPKVTTPQDKQTLWKSMPSSPSLNLFGGSSRPSSGSFLDTNIAARYDEDGLAPYLQSVITRVENNSYIQEIREMQTVPVLLRAEIGMALPCLTVRILNPFANQ